MQGEPVDREISYLPFKIGSFCGHRSQQSTSPYVDVVCNRREDTYHRVSQASKICNKCGETIVRMALVSQDCLFCADKIEENLNQQWVCFHEDPIYEEITIKCLDTPAEIHEVPFKSKVCKNCYDKIRAAFMYSNSCIVCAEKENELFENIGKTITLPAYYFFVQAVKEINRIKLPLEEARNEIESYCLAEPRQQIDSKLKKITESLGPNEESYHESKRYQLYPKCPKHRHNPVNLCNSCLASLLNVDSCPYGCPYPKQDKKATKKAEDEVKIFEGGFVYFYPKETRGQPYLEHFVFRMEEGSKYDRWEGRIKKIKLSEQSPIKNTNCFSLFAAVAEESSTRFLYTGGAVGPAIHSMKTTPHCFWISLSGDKKQFSLEETRPMLEARSSHSVAHLNGFIYACGGFNREQQACLNSCQRFDVGRGTWEKIAPMKVARSQATILVHQGSLFVLGGLSSSPEYLDNFCEKYNAGKNSWESVPYAGYGVPFACGAAPITSSGSGSCENALLLGGSDLSYVTKVVQSFKISSDRNEFDVESLGQNLAFSRACSAVCLMSTDSPSEKIALVFGGLEEHEPLLSLDAVRVRFQKGKTGQEIVPFFVYDNIEVGSYRLLLRESAVSTYQFMMGRLLEQGILSKDKFDKDADEVLKSEFNIHMIEKMWYGVGKCLMPLNL